MNILYGLQFFASRKHSSKNFSKAIYTKKFNFKDSLLLIKKQVSNISPISFLFFHLQKNIVKTGKILIKLFLVSYFLKFVFMYLRYYDKAFKKDFAFAQFYGYANVSDYSGLMNGRSFFDIKNLPYSPYIYVSYNQKSPVDSFLKVFNKYIYHPKFGEEIGKFLLILLKYEPKKNPKNDPINILLDDYISGSDFMDTLFILLKKWFTTDEFKSDILNAVIKALLSQKFTDNILDAAVYEGLMMLELPEVKEMIKEYKEYFIKPENNKDTILNMTDPEKIKKALRKIKKDKMFYLESPFDDDGFYLTRFNEFFLKVCYDFIYDQEDDEETDIIDFYYYENPLHKYDRMIDEYNNNNNSNNNN